MTNSPKIERNRNLLTNEYFEQFLDILKAMFKDDFSEGGQGRLKAKLTFDKLVNAGCKVYEFEITLKEFSNRHTFNFWMPAHIYQIWKEEFGPIGMVM